MSILSVLLMFLLITTVSYMHTRKEKPAHVADVFPQAPRMEAWSGGMPSTSRKAISFHPGHTWVLKEGRRRRVWDWTASP